MLNPKENSINRHSNAVLEALDAYMASDNTDLSHGDLQAVVEAAVKRAWENGYDQGWIDRSLK